MPNSLSEKDQIIANEKSIAQLSRRKFLGYAGAATGLMAVAAACTPEQSLPGMRTDAGISLGSGDIGILNYAYALEQLEAAFYTQVIMSTYANITASEKALLTDIRDHEIAHREFFKSALGSSAIPSLEVDFSKIDFGSRDSVLNTAKAFEDLGVSAYNGAGRLTVTPAYLVLAGQIVSVEARHAAYIRDLLSNGSFADNTIVDMNGLDGAKKPSEVLPIAAMFLKTSIDAQVNYQPIKSYKMNLNNIFGEIEKVDPEVYGRLDSRRKALKGFAKFGSKLALAAAPLAFGSLLNKSYAGSTSTKDSVVDILNYALTLEYLEAAFYNKGLATPNLIPGGAATGAIQTIAKHENAHVEFLKAAIGQLGGKAVMSPNFDYTAGKGSTNGPFKDVFNSLDLFLAVAQTFEDTGVRAYKGRAAEITGGGAYLTAALQIHSVEARHAAHIRLMRRNYGSGVGNVKPWITGKNSNINSSLVQASYDGEDSTMQAGKNIVNINGFMISADAATEAFDEVLTKEQVLKIVDPFIY